MSDTFSPVVSTRGERYATREELIFHRYQSKRFVFTIETNKFQSKIFQVFFSQRDGTINVNFPYIPKMKGIATIGVLSPFLAEQKVKLDNDGMVTTRKVKYAHKPDGRVHFSQDRQVRTAVKKQSIPLGNQDGHLFSLHVQGIDEFDPVQPGRDNAPPKLSRTVLNFRFPDKPPEAFKIVGMWHEARGFLQRLRGSEIGPTVNVRTSEGGMARGFLLGTVIGKPLQDYALLVTCDAQGSFIEPAQPSLLFIGGFDPAASPLDPYHKDRFLCLKYPVSDYEELERRLGSIDFDPPASEVH